MTSPKKHNESFFDKFDNAYEELLMTDVDEAKAFLVAEGFIADAKVDSYKKAIKKMKIELTASRNKQKDEALIKEKVFEKLKALINENKGLEGKELEKRLHEKAPAALFRNLDKLDDEGIRELLNEIDLVKLLEELDNEEGI